MGGRIEQLKARELMLMKELAEIRRELRTHIKDKHRVPIQTLGEWLNKDKVRCG